MKYKSKLQILCILLLIVTIVTASVGIDSEMYAEKQDGSTVDSSIINNYLELPKVEETTRSTTTDTTTSTTEETSSEQVIENTQETSGTTLNSSNDGEAVEESTESTTSEEAIPSNNEGTSRSEETSAYIEKQSSRAALPDKPVINTSSITTLANGLQYVSDNQYVYIVGYDINITGNSRLVVPKTMSTFNGRDYSNFPVKFFTNEISVYYKGISELVVDAIETLISSDIYLTQLLLADFSQTIFVPSMSIPYFGNDCKSKTVLKFNNTSSMKTCILPKSSASANKKSIFRQIQFAHCNKLENVDFGNQQYYVTDMNNMFTNCSSLRDLTFPSSFNASSVTSMNSMFNGCSSLTNLTFPSSFDTSSVTDMSYMFNGCDSLTDLTLPISFNTSSVTSMNSMFSGCSRLTNLILSSTFNTSSVTSMNSMFNGCDSLRDLTLPISFNTSSVTSMNSMFNGCISLTSLTLPSTFNTSSVKNMLYMFNGCSSLTNLTLPSSFNTSKVISMSYMFNGCSSLTNLTLPSTFNTSTVANMSYMFNGCSKLKTLSLPSSFNTSKVKNMSYMFNSCFDLKTLSLPSTFNTSSVTNMNSMFSGCISLTNLTLPSSFNTSKVTNMNNMFYTLRQSPLMLQTNDTKLKKYNYTADNRTYNKITFNSNGGQFENNTSVKNYITSCAIDYSQATADAVKNFISTNQPVKSGYQLVGWKDQNGQLLSNTNSFNSMLNKTYTAQWQKVLNPNPPTGSRLTGSQGNPTLYYLPIAFSTESTSLQVSGEQQIPFKETTGFHVGVKDDSSNTPWTLTACLKWQTSGLETSYIQVENPQGIVTSNQNNGTQAFAPSDLKATTEVTGGTALQIGSTPSSFIMKGTKAIRSGVYDYSLGQATLVIPEAKDVPANQYVGTVEWNLTVGP